MKYQRPFDRVESLAIRKHLESLPDDQRKVIEVDMYRLENAIRAKDKNAFIGGVSLRELRYKLAVFQVREGLV